MMLFGTVVNFGVAGWNAWLFSQYHNPLNLVCAFVSTGVGLFCLVVAAR